MALATTAFSLHAGASRILPLAARSPGAGSLLGDDPSLIISGLAWSPNPGNRMRRRATGDLRTNS
ncbi:MAG: hypothetical protein WAL64_00665 [Candidatus Dormiibacterota bacterium]